MFKTSNYLNNSDGAASTNSTEAVKDVIKYVMSHKADFEKELESLSSLNKKNPNKVFPIKIDNLVNGFNAFENLNTWYIERV